MDLKSSEVRYRCNNLRCRDQYRLGDSKLSLEHLSSGDSPNNQEWLFSVYDFIGQRTVRRLVR